MSNIYVPEKELSLDESMVLWRGRLVFRQYIKNISHKYCIKPSIFRFLVKFCIRISHQTYLVKRIERDRICREMCRTKYLLEEEPKIIFPTVGIFSCVHTTLILKQSLISFSKCPGFLLFMSAFTGLALHYLQFSFLFG